MIERIEEALKPLGYPVFDGYFDSSQKYKNAKGELIDITEYICYTVITESPIIYADNIDDYIELQVDVDFFTTSKSKSDDMRRLMRKALREADYTITDTVRSYESDTKYWHDTITVSCIEKQGD